jgi:type IV pilus assembly protein PilB
MAQDRSSDAGQDVGTSPGSEVRASRRAPRRAPHEFIELAETEVDARAAGLVDPQVLRRHGALPVGFEEGRLVVAIRDPKDLHALEDLSMLSGYRVAAVAADGEEIEEVSNRLFAIGPEVEELAAEPEPDDNVLDLGAGPKGEVPVVRLVSSILQRAISDGASDVHLEPRAAETGVRYRVDGVLREMMAVRSDLQDGLVARVKVLADLDIAERRVPQDGRLSVRLGSRTVELRVATLPTVFGEKIVLRLLDTSNVEVDLRRLGFEAAMLREYERVFRRPYGTILVTGPTGCGKSTTLYATLREISGPEKNIVTVEDPVEYRLPGVSQVQVNPKVGLGFATGLRSVLRADPDVVMIGEIRDHETARTSIEAALTGHLVLATLHTNDAPTAVTRLTDIGVEPYLTASAVDCVIAQRLARRLCEHCKRPVSRGRKVPDLPELAVPERALREAVGCRRCGGTGYRGRVGVYEMMVLDGRARDLIVRRSPTAELGRAAEAAGMTRLKQDGLAKAARGVTTVEEVLRTVL